MILLIALFLIVFEAVYEALYDTKHHIASEIIEFIYHAFVVLFIFAWFTWNQLPIMVYSEHYWHLIIAYVLLRYGIFDYIYNLIALLPLFYIGNTKAYDRIFSWFFDKTKIPAVHFLFMTKFIASIWGISWLIIYY